MESLTFLNVTNFFWGRFIIRVSHRNRKNRNMSFVFTKWRDSHAMSITHPGPKQWMRLDKHLSAELLSWNMKINVERELESPLKLFIGTSSNWSPVPCGMFCVGGCSFQCRSSMCIYVLLAVKVIFHSRIMASDSGLGGHWTEGIVRFDNQRHYSSYMKT